MEKRVSWRELRHGCSRLWLAVSLCSITGLAHALTINVFCVSTAKELQTALDQSSDGGSHVGETNVIRILAGTYKTTNTTQQTAFHYTSSATSTDGGLSISGGWAPGCETFSPSAAISVLDGNHATQVMSLTSAGSYIDVEALTIQNGETFEGGAGLGINVKSGQNGPASVSRTIVRNNHTTTVGGGVYVRSGNAGYTTFFTDNLITGNRADVDGGGGFLISEGFAEIYQNTVFDNTTADTNAVGGLGVSGGGEYAIVHSIFRGNTNIGLNLSTSNGALYYNDYGILGGTPPSINVGALMVSPGFVDAASGNFHLAVGSPLIGAAPALGGVTDLDGNQSPLTGRMDIGAYEETIFLDGFDG